MAGGFGAILFYEWFGNTRILADTTAVASAFAFVYVVFAVGWKYLRLRALGRVSYANSRLKIVGNVFYINNALIAAYFLERFFNWQIAAIGLVCLAIAYGLCRIIVCAVYFIRSRFEKA